jgi:hypothetical protein
MSIALMNEVGALRDRLNDLEGHVVRLTTTLAVEQAKRAELAQRVALLEDRVAQVERGTQKEAVRGNRAKA